MNKVILESTTIFIVFSALSLNFSHGNPNKEMEKFVGIWDLTGYFGAIGPYLEAQGFSKEQSTYFNDAIGKLGIKVRLTFGKENGKWIRKYDITKTKNLPNKAYYQVVQVTLRAVHGYKNSFVFNENDPEEPTLIMVDTERRIETEHHIINGALVLEEIGDQETLSPKDLRSNKFTLAFITYTLHENKLTQKVEFSDSWSLLKQAKPTGTVSLEFTKVSPVA